MLKNKSNNGATIVAKATGIKPRSRRSKREVQFDREKIEAFILDRIDAFANGDVKASKFSLRDISDATKIPVISVRQWLDKDLYHRYSLHAVTTKGIFVNEEAYQRYYAKGATIAAQRRTAPQRLVELAMQHPRRGWQTDELAAAIKTTVGNVGTVVKRAMKHDARLRRIDDPHAPYAFVYVIGDGDESQ